MVTYLNAAGDEWGLQNGVTQRHVGQKELLGALGAQLFGIGLVLDAQKVQLNGGRIGHDDERVALRGPLTRQGTGQLGLLLLAVVGGGCGQCRRALVAGGVGH